MSVIAPARTSASGLRLTITSTISDDVREHHPFEAAGRAVLQDRRAGSARVEQHARRSARHRRMPLFDSTRATPRADGSPALILSRQPMRPVGVRHLEAHRRPRQPARVGGVELGGLATIAQ